MARYRRMSLLEREELSRLLAAGHSLRAIGGLKRGHSSFLAASAGCLRGFSVEE